MYYVFHYMVLKVVFENKQGKVGEWILLLFLFVGSEFGYLHWVARGCVPLPNGYACARGGNDDTGF